MNLHGKNVFVVGTIVAALLAAPVVAQTPSYSQVIKSSWDSIKRNVSESAAEMPDADFAFKPTPDVRTFGQLIGHMANEHYAVCSAVKGEKNPSAEDIEKKTAKADLVKAINDSIAYCDGVYSSMTDGAGLQQVKLFDQDWTKAAALQFNVTHDSEHYGNLVTYLRLKKLVPPSSKRQSM
jgi:uncharacterized damage-inducible protein DinB